MLTIINTEERVHYRDACADTLLASYLARASGQPLTRSGTCVLCIGSDRSTGDALGPLVGTLLQKQAPLGLYVRGTLEEPVHAGNLAQTLQSLHRALPGATVVAIDACLGREENIGVISAGLGALKPGAGVRKTLPQVGDLHITATVNVAGFMEFLVLQNTRLSLVVGMAEVIARAVRGSLAHGLKATPQSSS